MTFQFFAEDISFELQNSSSTSDWITKIIEQHSYRIESITYIFCSDNYLLQVNREHLNHDYYTDIITFDNSEHDKTIDTDIFISIDRVTENANTEQTSFNQELHRVMIHGILHLLGFNDKTELEEKAMREKEEA
ncbi:MAG: rRNA maturation RNase YbeY, partial [Ekhidna sp.]|nr:rRNA maturation RNase YbeY [Ekhidna sp.]